jgi:hypothetical protein
VLQSLFHVASLRQTRREADGILDSQACTLSEIGRRWMRRIAQQSDSTSTPMLQWKAIHYVVAQDVRLPRGFDDFRDRPMPGLKDVPDI